MYTKHAVELLLQLKERADIEWDNYSHWKWQVRNHAVAEYHYNKHHHSEGLLLWAMNWLSS